MDITLIGLGYVGLPVACCLAKKGIKVHGIDINSKLINSLNNRTYNYTEPSLNSILDDVLDKTLFISNKIVESSIYIITVQTPIDEYHKSNNKYVENVLFDLAKILKDDDLVILESTVPIGSNEHFIKILKDNSNVNFDYCYCPESILPGNIFYEIENNCRTIGGIDEKSRLRAKEVYDIINVNNKYLTGIKEAEFVKLIQNSHRDVEIAFVNELSIMCDKEGVNPFEVINIAKNHPRCNLLYPGSGVGGHCLAVDPYFLIERFGDNASVINAARNANSYKPIYLANKAIEYINNDRNKVIGVLGLSYKPNCEDCRESSGITIVNYLIDKGFRVLANEVNVVDKLIHNIYNYSIDEVINNSDCIIIAQKHNDYIGLDFKDKKVMDSVNLINGII